MSTLIVELSTDLAARLDAAAGSVPGEKDRLVMVALEKLLEDRHAPVPKGDVRAVDLQPFPDGQTMYDLTKDVCGMFEGPGDLSTNPRYMEGFGED